MNDQTKFRRIAAYLSILAGPVTLASAAVLFKAAEGNIELMSNPAGLITLSGSAVEIFRWGSILELGSPALLLVPATIYLWYWLKPQSPKLVTLVTFLGLANLLVSTIGSLLRATFYPSLMNAYAQAPEVQRDVIMVIFQGVTDFTFEGLWAIELIFGGIWWLGIGPLLGRMHRIFGIITTIMGILYLLAGAGWLLKIDPLARLENVWLIIPFWTVWLGIIIWRHRFQ